MLQQVPYSKLQIRGATMKGYKNVEYGSIEKDLKRCRELAVLINQEQQRIENFTKTYSRLKMNIDDQITVEVSEKYLQDLIQERDSLVNKYFEAIANLKQNEKEILILYYIDNICIKQIASRLKVNERQIVYAKKQALEKLVQGR